MRLHSAHKLELLARSPRAYRELGRLAAEDGGTREYLELLALAREAEPTRGRHANALRHAAGFLPQPERGRCALLIDRFEAGCLPLDRPRRAIRAAARRHAIDWLLEQSYLR